MTQLAPVAPTTSSRRTQRQKGSAILEAALVYLPLMAISFAIIDYSLGIFVQAVLQNAVREGVRFAVTQQTGAGGQDAAVLQTVQNNAFGFLSGANSSYISVTYYSPQTAFNSATGTFGVANGVGSNQAGNICVVSVTNYPWFWVAPVMRSSAAFTFNATSSDVMESPPGGVLPAR